MSILILPSCSEEDPRKANMEDQAAAYQELAGIMNQLSDGKDVSSAKEKMSELVAQLMKLKEEATNMEKPEGDAAMLALQENKAYSEAISAYFEAQNKLTQSGQLDAEILAALQGFHKAPEPQVGEGSN